MPTLARVSSRDHRRRTLIEIDAANAAMTESAVRVKEKRYSSET